MPTVVPQARDGVVNFAGPLLLGHFFNICCYGVLSTQVYLYYLAFPRDKRLVKAVVYTLYMFESCQTALLISSAFQAFAAHYGDEAALASVHIDGFTIPMLSGIVSCIVQMFYARRTTILSSSKFLGLVIASLSALQVTAAIVIGIQMSVLQTANDLASTAPVSSSIWSGASALCDCVIATSTTWLLLRADVQFPMTKTVITRMIRIVIETGTLTATVAIVNLVLFFAFPTEGYYSCGVLVIAKLYSTSLLVLLNSRMRIVGSRNEYVCAEETWIPSGEEVPSRRIGPFTSASQLGLIAVGELPPQPGSPPETHQDDRSKPDGILSSASHRSLTKTS